MSEKIDVLKNDFPGIIPVTKSGKDGAVDAWGEDDGSRTILEAMACGVPVVMISPGCKVVKVEQ